MQCNHHERGDEPMKGRRAIGSAVLQIGNHRGDSGDRMIVNLQGITARLL